MVLLEVESFAGVKTHPMKRIKELVKCIKLLVKAGRWEPERPSTCTSHTIGVVNQIDSQNSDHVENVTGFNEENGTGFNEENPTGFNAENPIGFSNGSIYDDDNARYDDPNKMLSRKESRQKSGRPSETAMESARVRHFMSQVGLDRKIAQMILIRGGGTVGEFIVRAGSKGGWVLSVVSSPNSVKHFNLTYSDGAFVTSDGKSFPDIDSLLTAFKAQKHESLPCSLTHASTLDDEVIYASHVLTTDGKYVRKYYVND